MDVVTIAALVAAVAFVAALVYFSRKPEPPRGAYISEFELSLPSKKDKKQLKKEKKPAAPKPAGEKAAPVVSRRLKGVEGAVDDSTSDAQMLNFLSNRITLDSKGKASTSLTVRRDERDDEADEPVRVTKKAPKQVAAAADPVSAGFTAVVERKKPAKKEDESDKPAEPEAAANRKKAFYKEDQEAIKREQEARKAEKAEREKEKKERASRPRDPNEPRNLPPRLQKQQDGESATDADGNPRKPRAYDGPPRPKREFTPIAPATTEPFEEWSIDSILDSITATQPTPKTKKSKEEAVAAVEAQE